MPKHIKPEAEPIPKSDNISNQKVYHGKLHLAERPVSTAYTVIDTDLGRDNLENHLPEADLQDL